MDKRYITPEQIEKIKKYNDNEERCDCWSFTEDEDFLKGYTTMDNGDLSAWLRENVDIPYKAIVMWD